MLTMNGVSPLSTVPDGRFRWGATLLYVALLAAGLCAPVLAEAQRKAMQRILSVLGFDASPRTG